MIEFFIELIGEIADLFLGLWIDNIGLKRKKRSNKGSAV
ncbi:hypothetical protein SAMN05444373_100125 [Thermoclostridium caenicola]|uniref:Uncharacterized protein n=1 Tax=Thermoclostridium caenicola TaxID=659425 RepID=A0A1M6AFQ5_9FIRM|nr:hypothetical protein SAMN05444373_100125 [Thermoclostridium caenicola]